MKIRITKSLYDHVFNDNEMISMRYRHMVYNVWYKSAIKLMILKVVNRYRYNIIDIINIDTTSSCFEHNSLDDI